MDYLSKKYLKSDRVFKYQCSGAQPGRIMVYCFKPFQTPSEIQETWLCPDPNDIEFIESYHHKYRSGQIEQIKMVFIKKSFYNNKSNWW